jgi:hypothetical protein
MAQAPVRVCFHSVPGPACKNTYRHRGMGIRALPESKAIRQVMDAAIHQGFILARGKSPPSKSSEPTTDPEIQPTTTGALRQPQVDRGRNNNNTSAYINGALIQYGGAAQSHSFVSASATIDHQHTYIHVPRHLYHHDTNIHLLQHKRSQHLHRPQRSPLASQGAFILPFLVWRTTLSSHLVSCSGVHRGLHVYGEDICLKYHSFACSYLRQHVATKSVPHCTSYTSIVLLAYLAYPFLA